MTSHNQYLARYMTDALAAGLSYNQADALRRDAQRLCTIAVHECNGTKYRCEESGATFKTLRGIEKPLVENAVYNVWNINGPGPIQYTRTRDTETPACARIDAMAASIGATVEYQGDPRGWPVKLILADGKTELHPPVRG